MVVLWCHCHGVEDQPVMAVLGPVPVDHLVAAVIFLQGEVHLQYVSTRLDDLQDSWSQSFRVSLTCFVWEILFC